MRNIKEQTESIQLSMYCNIICQILKSHDCLSLYKTLTFSYLIKHERFLGGTVYNANNTQDVVFKGISLLAGDFEGFCNSIPYIIKSLHILITKDLVVSNNNILSLSGKDLKIDFIYKENNFMKKVIEQSKTMTDRQFMKEVTYNV